MKASLFQCSHVIIFSPQVIVSRMGTVRSTRPLTVLEQWFTVLFKTVTLFRSCKSLVLLLRGRHVLPHLELLFVAWLLLVGFAPHAAFSFSSDAGDAQGEIDASLPRCLAGAWRCDWNYLSAYEFPLPSQMLLEEASGIFLECTSCYFYHTFSAMNRE